MNGNNTWLAPLTGAIAIAIAIISIVVIGETPSANDDSAQEIADFYVDNKDSVFFSAALGAIAATFVVFFYGFLSRLLRGAGGEGGMLPLVMFGGAAIFAAGIGIDGSIAFAMAESADDIDPAGIHTLQALYDNDFLTFALGVQLMMVAGGISIVKNAGVLPAAMGWIAIALGVIAITPLGFVGVIGFMLWTLVASIMLTMKARTA
jgi:hypothetical protein